ncbi:isochorismatase family protein [Microbacterium sp. SLBN-111]|uniref:isochorismatase family protein n=1 Tax=Microbacterium sp. SLBN-111 TaxID=3377733 RepID=UPI003C789E3F
MNSTAGLIAPEDAVLLMVDHQSGLLQVVRDISIAELRMNVASVTKAATLAGVPVIATASVPAGTNGPLIPEVFDNAPHTTYVSRQGQINAWDVEGFRAAVEATGRKTLLIAGIMTSICVVEPALAALADGYTVYAIIDASGAYSDASQRISIARLTQAGVVVVDTEAVISELQQTWARADYAEWGALHSAVIPSYFAAAELAQRSAAEATGGEGADAEVKWAEARRVSA